MMQVSVRIISRQVMLVTGRLDHATPLAQQHAFWLHPSDVLMLRTVIVVDEIFDDLNIGVRELLRSCGRAAGVPLDDWI